MSISDFSWQHVPLQTAREKKKYRLFQAENLLWQISMHTQIRAYRYILKQTFYC